MLMYANVSVKTRPNVLVKTRLKGGTSLYPRMDDI